MLEPESLKDSLFAKLPIEAIREIGINDHIFFMGSCFSENIGNRFHQLGFSTFINPFGIQFNPASMATALNRIANKNEYTEQDLYFHNGQFHSLEHHGSFSHADRDTLLSRINSGIESAAEFIRNAQFAILTPGTSFVYFHHLTNSLVSNCHKIPGSEFSKRMLTDAEVLQSYEAMCTWLRKLNPAIRIIFTISPVKHLKDGVLENAASKARLLSALHQFLDSDLAFGASYFPAFEIVQEELRDHRFYAEDLAHPSSWTVLYIFQRFCQTWLTDRATDYTQLAIQYARMLSHRTMTEDPAAIEIWEQQKRDFLTKIQDRFPEKIKP